MQTPSFAILSLLGLLALGLSSASGQRLSCDSGPGAASSVSKLISRGQDWVSEDTVIVEGYAHSVQNDHNSFFVHVRHHQSQLVNCYQIQLSFNFIYVNYCAFVVFLHDAAQSQTEFDCLRLIIDSLQSLFTCSLYIHTFINSFLALARTLRPPQKCTAWGTFNRFKPAVCEKWVFQDH